MQMIGQTCMGPRLWALSADKMCQAQSNTLWEPVQTHWLAKYSDLWSNAH